MSNYVVSLSGCVKCEGCLAKKWQEIVAVGESGGLGFVSENYAMSLTEITIQCRTNINRIMKRDIQERIIKGRGNNRTLYPTLLESA